jgi:hypothetical protein
MSVTLAVVFVNRSVELEALATHGDGDHGRRDLRLIPSRCSKGYKKKIATARKGKYIVATINLKGLPKGAFTVKIHATTVLGHTLSASRTYHTCIKKIKKSSKKK